MSVTNPDTNIQNSHYKIYMVPEKNEEGKTIIRKLLKVSMVAVLLMGLELLGGWLASSLAIMTDAAHMFSDFCGFFISIFSVWLAMQPSDDKNSFGYHRAEIIGALISVIIIWILTFFLVMEAISRILNPNFNINTNVMLITSIFAFLSNLVMIQMLHGGGHGHSHGGHGHSHGGQGSDDPHRPAEGQDYKEFKDEEEKNHHEHSIENNANMRAAMIHIIGDLI
jgi:solute carrier family 30 (zinc transporter), member 2